MRISLIQSSLIWENPQANREVFSKKILPLKGLSDLVILPEMFTTGFSLNPLTKAENFRGRTLDWMLKMASETEAAIIGSIMIKENGNFFNRLIFAKPDNTFEYYDKRHLFRMAGEDQHYAQGEKRLIVEWKGWRIMPQICYDLRFPMWSRNIDFGIRTSQIPIYDLLIYVANWPEQRRLAWNKLIPARAIENSCYVVGLNRVGSDINNNYYSGNSVVCDYLGNALSNIIPNEEQIETLELDKIALENFRLQFPVWRDADNFSLKI